MKSDICEKLRAWHDQYPDPSATVDQNQSARAKEDKWLANLGAGVLVRDIAASMRVLVAAVTVQRRWPLCL